MIQMCFINVNRNERNIETGYREIKLAISEAIKNQMFS